MLGWLDVWFNLNQSDCKSQKIHTFAEDIDYSFQFVFNHRLFHFGSDYIDAGHGFLSSRDNFLKKTWFAGF